MFTSRKIPFFVASVDSEHDDAVDPPNVDGLPPSAMGLPAVDFRDHRYIAHVGNDTPALPRLLWNDWSATQQGVDFKNLQMSSVFFWVLGSYTLT